MTEQALDGPDRSSVNTFIARHSSSARNIRDRRSSGQQAPRGCAVACVRAGAMVAIREHRLSIALSLSRYLVLHA